MTSHLVPYRYEMTSHLVPYQYEMTSHLVPIEYKVSRCFIANEMSMTIYECNQNLTNHLGSGKQLHPGHLRQLREGAWVSKMPDFAGL